MSKRFKVSTAERMMLAVLAKDPGATLEAPSTSLFGGCADRDHCPQHHGTYDGEAMVQFRTILSGTELHRIKIQCEVPVIASTWAVEQWDGSR